MLVKRFPAPAEIIRRVKALEIILWEKRFEDSDFLTFRLGLGETPSLVKVKAPDPDSNSSEIRRAFNIYTEYRNIPRSPIVVDLREIGSVAIVGERNDSLPLARSVLIQLASLNSPDDVHLYVFSSEPYYRTWKWLRWLPHTNENHIGGQPSFLAFTRRANNRLIGKLSKAIDLSRQQASDGDNKAFKISTPVTLVLFDHEISIRDEPFFSEIMKKGNQLGISSIILCEKLEDVPSECRAVITVSERNFRFSRIGSDGIKTEGIAEQISLIEADHLAHRLLPIAIRTLGQGSRIPSRVNMLQIYQANRLDELHIEERWKRLPNKKDGLLPFPILVGSETYATPMEIHLAENLDGPHGLIAGTTGSGKSELLQALVSSLAIEHNPYFVKFFAD